MAIKVLMSEKTKRIYGKVSAEYGEDISESWDIVNKNIQWEKDDTAVMYVFDSYVEGEIQLIIVPVYGDKGRIKQLIRNTFKHGFASNYVMISTIWEEDLWSLSVCENLDKTLTKDIVGELNKIKNEINDNSFINEILLSLI